VILHCWPCTPNSINCFSHIYYTWNKRTHERCLAGAQWGNCTFWLQCTWYFKQTFSELLDLPSLFTNKTHAITVAAMQLWSFHTAQYCVSYCQWISGWRFQSHSDKLRGAVEHAVTTITPKILQSCRTEFGSTSSSVGNMRL
jgi:hypothetical protein